MPTYRVHITETLDHIVTVTADNSDDAETQAIEDRCDSTVTACTELETTYWEEINE